MKRRDFLRATGGSGGAVALGSGVAAGQEGTGTATGTEGGGGGGSTTTVAVGPGGDYVFTPGTNEPLRIEPGTTVNFVWESNNHNVVPTSQPEGANWPGEGEPGTTFDTGHEYSYTFETLGTYEYVCTPHEQLGMIGTIEVVENVQPAGAGGGGERELHSIGAPIHPHWVGAATILMMFVSIVFTFYVLKYGESPNTGNTGGGE